MITLNGHFLNNPVAVNALHKLADTKLEAHCAYRISKIIDAVDKELKNVGVKAIEHHKRHCKLDEVGNPTGLDKGKLQFENPEKEKEHDEGFLKLLDYEFTIKVNLIPLAEIGNSLTPNEVKALSNILWLPKD